MGKFTVAAFLGIFGTEDRLDLVATEGEDQRVVVVGDVAAGRHGLIIAKHDVTAAIVSKAVEELFVFANFPGKEGGRL